MTSKHDTKISYMSPLHTLAGLSPCSRIKQSTLKAFNHNPMVMYSFGAVPSMGWLLSVVYPMQIDGIYPLTSRSTVTFMPTNIYSRRLIHIQPAQAGEYGRPTSLRGTITRLLTPVIQLQYLTISESPVSHANGRLTG